MVDPRAKIDLHAHLLPDILDSLESITTELKLLNVLREKGIERVNVIYQCILEKPSLSGECDQKPLGKVIHQTT